MTLFSSPDARAAAHIVYKQPFQPLPASPCKGEECNNFGPFDVDLDAPVPDLKALEEKFSGIPSRYYERKFSGEWTMPSAFNGGLFDAAIFSAIAGYGQSERRLKTEDEDDLLKMLAMLPPETYPYIGPMLHTIPNMSEKILNLPGIKETKNKFPKRIAPQLAHIEDLEFLSPFLYFLLMPEMWPENRAASEKPLVVPRTAKIPNLRPGEQVMEAVRKFAPTDDFSPDAAARKAKKSAFPSLRTVDTTRSSPLTSADIQAFARSLADVAALEAALKAEDGLALSLYHAGMLMDAAEEMEAFKAGDYGKIIAGGRKDLVNPCARAVRKLQVLGRELDLLKIVAKSGFDAKSWALTCDKVVKAYRKSTISSATAATLSAYRKGFYDDWLLGDPELVGQQKATMAAMAEMYAAPMADVAEVRKNYQAVDAALKLFGSDLFGSPIFK